MKKELPPSRTAEQFVVRLPEGMRELIAEQAKLNSRSMNSEITARLSHSLGLDHHEKRAEELLRDELQRIRKHLEMLTLSVEKITARDKRLKSLSASAKRIVDRES